ncbi:ribosome biogenesis regulatory protein homolog [Nilaparvata lugens]|uniref:ribosome biogenesis regulatory protein homolog n=1 Tax=Nilaparvata lugens TaxID=108931 RepID=UPI00193CF644|nr:ribosome biogenesis regulatory protein homolog [Nilaparvata lugens]
MGILTSDKLSSTELKTAEGVAKLSTASLGKFQPKLRKEKENIKQKNIPGVQKRKMTVVPAAVEKASNLEILDGILNKKPKLDVDKAVNKQIFVEQQQRAQEKKNEKPKGKGKRKGHAKGGGAGGGAGAKGGGAKGKKSAMIASKIGKVKGKRKHGGSAGGKKVGKRYSGGGKRR